MREPVEDLIRQHQKHLFAAAFNVCQNASDADDVVQDTFLKYYLSKKEFESSEHIKAWLLRVAINKAKDLTRRLWRHNLVSFEGLGETPAAKERDEQWLFTEVMHLPEKYRIVLHLFYYEEYSVHEIAQVLKVSESNVKTRLSRGRRLLKGNIEEDLVYD